MIATQDVYFQPVLYPSDSELFNEGMHVWVSLTTRRHSESNERVGSVERAPILLCPRVKGLICRFVHFISLGRTMSSTTNWSLLSRRDEPMPGRALHPVFVQDIVVGRFLAGNHCHFTSHQQATSRRAIPGSCIKSPSTGGLPSCPLARPPGIPQIPCRRPFPVPPWTLPQLFSLSCGPGFGGATRASSHGARWECARALIGHGAQSPRVCSSDASVGLTQFFLPSGLSCQHILPSFSLFNSPPPLQLLIDY